MFDLRTGGVVGAYPGYNFGVIEPVMYSRFLPERQGGKSQTVQAFFCRFGSSDLWLRDAPHNQRSESQIGQPDSRHAEPRLNGTHIVAHQWIYICRFQANSDLI